MILVAKELSNYLKHSNQTLLLLHSISAVSAETSFYSLNTQGVIFGKEEMTELSEALKVNSSLMSLDLTSDRLVDSTHSHSIQGIILAMKEPSNYLRHSNQIQRSLHSISAVTDWLIYFVLTQYSY
jgi:hypothetical protein